MKGIQFLKDFAESALVKAAMSVVNKVFLSLIEDSTVEQVNQAIKEDTQLWDRFTDRERYLNMGLGYKNIIVENIGRLSPTDILKLMAESGEPWESQAGIIINTPGGTEWFKRQVDNIKNGIMEYYHEHNDGQDTECSSA